MKMSGYWRNNKWIPTVDRHYGTRDHRHIAPPEHLVEAWGWRQEPSRSPRPTPSAGAYLEGLSLALAWPLLMVESLRAWWQRGEGERREQARAKETKRIMQRALHR